MMHDDMFLRVLSVDIDAPTPAIIVSLCRWLPST